MTTRFSAPINPERPKGAPSCAKCAPSCAKCAPSCAKCAHSFTAKAGAIYILVCDFGLYTAEPCDLFADASVERTERRGLKAGYDAARVA